MGGGWGGDGEGGGGDGRDIALDILIILDEEHLPK